MRKRNVLLSLMLAVVLLLTACGGGNPFEGKWKGTLDLTEQFEDGIKANYPDFEEYVDFEDLVLVMNVEFTEDEMSMSVEEDSIDAFFANFEAGMQEFGESAFMAYLTSIDMTLEEAVAESGMEEEEFLEQALAQMQLHEMTSGMNAITEQSLAGLADLTGTYTFNEEEINLRYSDESYEAIPFEFEGKKLILTFEGEEYFLRIECEK